MRIFLLINLLLVTFNSFSSHLVGVDLRVEHVYANVYEVILTTYVDNINSTAGAIDSTVQVNIFSNTTNELLNSYLLPQVYISRLNSSYGECSDGIIITSAVIYKKMIAFEYDQFTDLDGYYLSWERCCRQYNLTNIYSENPGSGGISAGFTAYCEIPSLANVNSSPKMKLPTEVIGCTNIGLQLDFGATDLDGDSLVYSIVTPFSSFDTQNSTPNSPNPAPYPEINWKFGFDINNVLGTPNSLVMVQTDGLITGIPEFTGNYAYTVKCEEFRNGVKIGEVRRDFSLLVIDDCSTSFTNEPTLLVYNNGSSDVLVNDQKLIREQSEELVFELKVVDVPTIDEDAQNVGVMARLKTYFNNNSIRIDTISNVPLLSENDTAFFKLTIDNCVRVEDYHEIELEIIAFDSSCPVFNSDTLNLIIDWDISYPVYNTEYSVNNDTNIIHYTDTLGSELLKSPISILVNYEGDIEPNYYLSDFYGQNDLFSLQKVNSGLGFTELELNLLVDCNDDIDSLKAILITEYENGCTINHISGLALDLVLDDSNQFPISLIGNEELVFQFDQPKEIVLNDIFNDPEGDEMTYRIVNHSQIILDPIIIDGVLRFESDGIGHGFVTLSVNDTFCNSLVATINLNIESITSFETVMDDQYWDLTVFPNPSSDFVQINCKNTSLIWAEILMFNAAGCKVDCNFDKIDNYTVNIDISNLDHGFYILVIQNQNNHLRYKVIVE